MSNSNLLNILKNKAFKKKNAVLKITTSAIPTVQDPTLQTWIKSIDTSLRQLSKTSVSKTELDSAIASSGSGSSIGSDPNDELPDDEIDLTVPSAVTNLQASGAYSSVTLDWDTPKNSNFGRNVVYRSEVDDFGTAVEIGSTVGDVYTDYAGNGGKYYYWVRTISKYDVEGDLSTSVYAETSINVQYLLDQLTEKINQNQFTQALKSTIDLIPSIGSKIDDFFSQYAGSTDDYAGTNDMFAGHISEESIRIEADEAMAEKIDFLAVKVDEDITAAILNESSVRASQNEAMAHQITTLEVKVNEDITAAIQNEASVRVAENSALAEQVTTISAKVNNDISAAIQQEATTRASAYSALSKTIKTVQTTVDGHTSSIQETKTAVDGINAEWKIKVKAGGKISGVSLGTTGAESQFLVLADRFAIGQTTGTTTTYPFIVESGKVIMNVAVIKDGSIEAAKIGNLAADKITTGDIAADRMKANIVKAVSGQFNSLSAITGTIGTLRTKTSGARTEIKDNLIEVYDESGQVRVRLGVW